MELFPGRPAQSFEWTARAGVGRERGSASGRQRLSNEKENVAMTKKNLVGLIVLGALALASAKAQDRLPPIPADKMTEVQKKTAAEYKQIRKTDLGAGPFGVLLRVPDYVVPALEMRLHNLNNSALSRKL